MTEREYSEIKALEWVKNVYEKAIKEINEKGNAPGLVSRVDRTKAIIDVLQKIQQYRAIGTVEECRKAREKEKPETPNIWGDGYDKEGNMIYDMYDCPNCGKSYEIDDCYKHCPECGQAIDQRALKI